MKTSSVKKQPKNCQIKTQRYFTPQISKHKKDNLETKRADKFNITTTCVDDVSKNVTESKKFNTPIKKTQKSKVKEENADELEIIKMNKETLNDCESEDEYEDSDVEGSESEDNPSESESDDEDDDDDSNDENSSNSSHIIDATVKPHKSPKNQDIKKIASPSIKKAMKRKRAASSDEEQSGDEVENSANESSFMPPPDKRKRTGLLSADSIDSMIEKTKSPNKKPMSLEKETDVKKKRKRTKKEHKDKNTVKIRKEVVTILPDKKEPNKMPTEPELRNEIDRRSAEKDKRTVILQKLPKDSSYKMLRNYCKKAVTIYLNLKQSSAFITFASHNDAVSTIAYTKKRLLNGKNISAALSSDKHAKKEGNRQLDYNTQTLYISCLPSGVDQLELAKIFPEASNIKCANYEGEKLEGTATIGFTQKSHAVNAFYSREGTTINGVPIIINFKIKPKTANKSENKPVLKNDSPIVTSKKMEVKSNGVKVKKEKQVLIVKKKK